MDGVSSQVMFSFERLRSTVDDPEASWQLLLRVVADFAVTFEGRRFFTETEFPVVKFASQAAKWMRSGAHDFAYVSMESAEEPLLAFYRSTDHRLRVYSPHQEFEFMATVEWAQLRAALGAFIEEVIRRVGSELELDVLAVLE